MSHESTKSRGLTPELQQHLVSSAVLPAGLVFLELVFKFATGGSVWPSVFVIVPLSIGIGLLFDLLCSLVRPPKARRLVKLALLLLAGVLFCVEYFVFRQFKVYYDPATVLSGAGDAAGQFSGEALQLVLSPTGLVHIALFLLPAIAYALWGVVRGSDPMVWMDVTDAVVQACAAAEAHLLAFLLIACLAPMGELYTSRYSFQSSVDSFGMLTSLRKEVQARLSGSDSTLRIQVPSESQDDSTGAEETTKAEMPATERELT